MVIDFHSFLLYMEYYEVLCRLKGLNQYLSRAEPLKRASYKLQYINFLVFSLMGRREKRRPNQQTQTLFLSVSTVHSRIEFSADFRFEK